MGSDAVGWLDRWLGPRRRTFAEVEDREEYERLIVGLGELSGLALAPDCRVDGRAVALEIRCGDRLVVHVQDGWFADLEGLLPALNALLPPGESRRLVAYEEERFGEELGVAFADPRGVERLRRAGVRVFTRDPPRTEGALEIDGIRLRAPISFHPDGAPNEGVLAEDTVVDGIPCAGGAPIGFDVRKRGRPAVRGTALRATLSRPVSMPDLVLPAGARVDLTEGDPTIAVAALPHAREVLGLALPAGAELQFRDDGTLYAVTWDDGPWIGFADGRWDEPAPGTAPPPSPYATRTLARDEDIDRHALPAGTEVTTLDGALILATLRAPLRIDGVPCGPGGLGFRRGRLTSAVLGEDTEREGLRLRAGTSLLLWEDPSRATRSSAASRSRPARGSGSGTSAASRRSWCRGRSSCSAEPASRARSSAWSRTAGCAPWSTSPPPAITRWSPGPSRSWTAPDGAGGGAPRAPPPGVVAVVSVVSAVRSRGWTVR
jgi:hypothetical protein